MYTAVIFDMNGVIVEDERIHQESWRQLCKKYGFQLTEDEFTQNVFGRTEKDVLNYLFKRELSEDEVQNYSDERVDIAIEIFKPHLQLTDGLADFLKMLKQHAIPTAIATSSRNRYANFILDNLAIRDYFQFIVTAQDIEKGKPDPEIYLKAAQGLKVDPTHCVAFEDSRSGIKSGKTAGMKVIGITTTHTKEDLDGADEIIASFVGLSLDQVLN